MLQLLVCKLQTAKLVLDEYFESAGALEAMGAGSGDFFTLSQRPAAALLLRDDAALNGADDDVFVAEQDHAGNTALAYLDTGGRARSTD